jgi:hypothetical protein
MWIGTPLPLFHIRIIGGSWGEFPGWIVTCNFVHVSGCRNRLSVALTNISSNIFINAGIKPYSLCTIRYRVDDPSVVVVVLLLDVVVESALDGRGGAGVGSNTQQ